MAQGVCGHLLGGTSDSLEQHLLHEALALAILRPCDYRNNMPKKLKVARIGNSRGVRLPAETLHRYRIGDMVVMEERSEGILLRPSGKASKKLSWEGTAKAMAAASENWGAWDATTGDGLESAPWEAERADRVAERGPRYRARKTSAKRRR